MRFEQNFTKPALHALIYAGAFAFSGATIADTDTDSGM